MRHRGRRADIIIAGAIYAIFDRVGATSAAFLIPFVAGVALVLGGILINVEWLWSGLRRRSFLAGLNAWLMAGLAVLLLAIANAMSPARRRRNAGFLDLTQARLHTLSAQTRNILKGLQKEVRITVAIGSGQVQSGYGVTVEAGEMVKDLAEQYRAHSRKVQGGMFLNVYRDKSLADEAFARIEEKTTADSVIVECGRKSVDIPFTDLVEAPAGNPFGAPSEPPSFKGEDKLSSAILNVTEVLLDEASPSLRILEAVRDECHRFATTLNKKKRAKRVALTLLESVQGVGQARSRRLMQVFGSVEAILGATVDEVQKKAGLPRETAAMLLARLAERYSTQGDGEGASEGRS